MEYKLSAREFSLNCHGLNFLCILGTHINGGFVAIVNWGVSAELSSSRSDLTYILNCVLKALERSPDFNWLPSDVDARRAVARDLTMMIMDRMSS